MNPAAAFAATVVDELIRCGLTEAVIAPGSRSTPLALALWDRAEAGDLRLHVRIDERSAAFLALGLAKASGRPAAVVCTSGTAAAHFHAAVIEADEAAVPLLVLTADRPPELRGTGANQTIDQLKLYGAAVRWFCEAGVPEERPGMNAYWRSLACRAWATACGTAGGLAGPVHVNVPLREPLVPAADRTGQAAAGWPEPLAGRADGQPWTRAEPASPAAGPELPWRERGVVVCGDGAGDVTALLELAGAAGWPVLAEPSSGARRGPHALAAYQFLLASPQFLAAHQPDVIVVAGRPSLSRAQLAFLRLAGRPAAPVRQVVIGQGPGRWADPARAATDLVPALGMQWPPGGPPGPGGWLASWQRADTAARRATDAILDATSALTGPRLARDLAGLLPDGALLWSASSLAIRELDEHMRPRDGVRVLANRGASGIDGMISAALGAALAHQAAGGGRAVASLGDLAFLHDVAGLALGPDEPRPDLTFVVVNNDGGGIFASLEQAELTGPFERVFATPHGARLSQLAAAFGVPYRQLRDAAQLAEAVGGSGLAIAEARVDRAAGAQLRARLREAAAAAAAAASPPARVS